MKPAWSPSKDHLLMQLMLFGGGHNQVAPPRSLVAATLQELRARKELFDFRIWLVGSQLDSSRASIDVDIVLSPARGQPPDGDVDRALWVTRAIGVRRPGTRIQLDPMYRVEGPCRDVVPLLPDTLVCGVQLLSPRRMFELLTGGLDQHRLVGRFSIEFSRRAADTNFFAKLPEMEFDGVRHRYLRPAREVVGPSIGGL